MKNKILTISLLALIFLALSLPAYAVYTIPEKYAPNNVPFTDTTNDAQYYNNADKVTVTILQILAGGLLYFAAPLAIMMIVFSGFNMVIFGSDTTKVGEAKKHLAWTLIGLLVIILSYSIVRTLLEISIPKQ